MSIEAGCEVVSEVKVWLDAVSLPGSGPFISLVSPLANSSAYPPFPERCIGIKSASIAAKCPPLLLGNIPIVVSFVKASRSSSLPSMNERSYHRLPPPFPIISIVFQCYTGWRIGF